MAARAAKPESELAFRPARLIFFEGSHQKASSYSFITSLPAAGELPQAGDTFPGNPALTDAEPGGQTYGWLQWSRGSYGMALGTALSETEALTEEARPVSLSVYFAPQNLLFVPSYQYTQEEDGAGETGYLDLYLLYMDSSGRSWVSIDPGVQRNFQSRRTVYSFGFEAGRVISSFFGDGGIYARPGVQMEADRPYDWNLEVGIQINY